MEQRLNETSTRPALQFLCLPQDRSAVPKDAPASLLCTIRPISCFTELELRGQDSEVQMKNLMENRLQEAPLTRL